MKARYFKIESFGNVDGPGTRMILFLQGCPLRCKYCHNPESWDMIGDSTWISIEEVIENYNRNINFYKNGGGITVSGGEPWLHLDFLIELGKVCQKEKIHLTIDTAAYFFKPEFEIKNKILIDLIDLWLIDIKHINPEKYELITGAKSEKQSEIKFIEYLEKKHKPYWVRQVIVPGLTDEPDDLVNLGKFVSKLKYCQKFEILPYHLLMYSKYENMGLKTPLPGVSEPTDNQIAEAKKWINIGINQK
ncbi:MAG: pyruvate formate-lyase-activating protein [Mycoplasmoidaceae bacterium]